MKVFCIVRGGSSNSKDEVSRTVHRSLSYQSGKLRMVHVQNDCGFLLTFASSGVLSSLRELSQAQRFSKASQMLGMSCMHSSLHQALPCGAISSRHIACLSA